MKALGSLAQYLCFSRVKMTMAANSESIGALLDCLPLDTVEFAFAYGSGAFSQAGENTADKMVDFVVASNDSSKFHLENLKRNPRHYSAIRYLGSGAVCELQRNHAARVFYNTHIRHKVCALIFS